MKRRYKVIAGISAWIFLAFPITAAPASAELIMSGPGGRIHGADISRWQHPYDKQINFAKMHTAGVRFVMIKASDTRDDADQLARKYVYTDRTQAQSAGIYTGFYHYAILPNVTTPAAVTKDAKNQAQKVIWRLSSLGGYNELDLPYALDLENNCIQLRSNKSCAKYATRSNVTLWAKTFLETVKNATGRTPILYSYPMFLENAMNRDKTLAQYPLWLAQYAIDPTHPESRPGVKKVGCYVHSWTTSQCISNWTVWQYTSCGIAPKYGVPGTRLDLNVFRGDEKAFANLASGTWEPGIEDLMPVNETSTMTLNSQIATTTDKYVIFSVDVVRPDSSAVVTGDVRFYAGNNETPLTFKQTVERQTSGSWKIALSQVPAGTWNGRIQFKDVSGTHAPVQIAVSFTVNQGPTVAPTPTKKPSPTPASNGCKNQIKN